MSRPGPKTKLSKNKIAAARSVIGSLPYSNPVMTAFIVLLKAQGKLTQAEIAEVAGISVATVKRRVNAQSAPSANTFVSLVPDTRWGGDRRSFLSDDKARKLLNAFAEDARKGKLVTVKSIKNAAEREIGHVVALQTIYNLLKRHHWFKVISTSESFQRTSKKTKCHDVLSMRYKWLPPEPDGEDVD